MSRLPPRLIVMALGAVLAQNPAAGQTHAELRGGFSVGSHTATAAGLDFAPAFSYEALIMQQVTPLFSVYGGYARTTFGCEEGFCLDRDLTVAGSHGVLGVEGHKAWAWLRLGLLLGVTEVGTEGDPPDLGPGFHAGAGVSFGWDRISLRPGVSYRRMGARTPSSSDHAAAVTADLGVAIRLGSIR